MEVQCTRLDGEIESVVVDWDVMPGDEIRSPKRVRLDEIPKFPDIPVLETRRFVVHTVDRLFGVSVFGYATEE